MIRKCIPFLCFLALVGPALAQNAVAPPAWETVEAPSSSTIPFGMTSGTGRYQQVYDEIELTGMAAPQWVTGVSFRANQNTDLLARSMDCSIWLSSPKNSADNLSGTFAKNRGQDEVLVFEGIIHLPDVAASPGPAPFAWNLPFQRPFHYKGQGLLMEMEIRWVSGGATGGRCDGVNDPQDGVSRVYNSSDWSASSGTKSSLGLITEFTYEPFTPFHFTANSLSAATGGYINVSLEAGAQNAGRKYWIVGSASGTSPGWDAGSITIPINYDSATLAFLRMANGDNLSGFQGTLDASGHAEARIDSLGPIDPGQVGMVYDFAFVLVQPIDYASNPCRLSILP